jgi:hypothetical protein
MPITSDGSGKITYSEPQNKQRTDATHTFVDDEFAICDAANVLKQVKFTVNPTTAAKGTLTLQCDVGADATVQLSSLMPTSSFATMQPITGTTPTASTPTDTLTFTSSDNTIAIVGNSSTKTLDFKTNVSNTYVDVAGDTMTGALGIAVGSVSAPGLFGAGDTNTGVWFPAADTMELATAGAAAVRINATRQVTIGTPAAAISANTALHIKNLSDSDSDYGGLVLESLGSGSSRIWNIRGASSGNLAIRNNLQGEFALQSSNNGQHTILGSTPGSTNSRASVGSSDSNTTVTDWSTSGGIKAGINFKNVNSTNNNMCGVAFLNNGNGNTSSIVGVHENHNADGSATGHLEFIVNNAGTRASALKINANGQVVHNVVGAGISIKEGSNAKMGQAVLVGGTVTVSTTAVTANSRIFLTIAVAGGVLGILSVGTLTAATSFVINSSSASDTSTVNWLIFEPS